MPLPDHLSPLAWGSGDTCGFDIMHRCDLGEGNYSCGITSAAVTGLWNRGGQEGGEVERPTGNLRLCRFLHPPWDSIVVCVLHRKESMSYTQLMWTKSPEIMLVYLILNWDIKQNKGATTKTSIGKRPGSLSTQTLITRGRKTFSVKVRIVNIFTFGDHMVSVTTAQFCVRSSKMATRR